MRIERNIQSALALLSAASILGMMATPVLAQTPPKRHRRSFIHSHPNATAAAAGVGAYKLARHRKHGFIHRHPYLTGAAAAAAAHHIAKKHQ